MRYTFLLLALACDSNVKIVPVDVVEDVVTDLDGDGYSENEGDCDDSDGSINIGAAEICDGIDNNCDGAVDEGVKIPFYADSDGDGFGNAQDIQEACESPEGYVPNGNDCDDTRIDIYPSADEICDGIDNDCNDLVDDGLGLVMYQDADFDGFGDPDFVVEGCQDEPGLSGIAGDCDDSNPALNPDAAEACDELDNNCDGAVDEGVQETYYLDADADGFGDLNVIEEACSRPAGYSENSDDCDDGDTAIFPSASEVCDEIDNNCDSLIDDSSSVNQSTYYSDTDGDGFGDASSSVESCTLAAGFSANDQDCDDSDSNVNPDASEVCDGIDNDCDLAIDDADPSVSGASTWYLDADVDGFGNSSFTMYACLQPSGFVADSSDCNDIDAAVNPNASEVCDEIDNDCDGDIDDDDATLDQSTRVLSYSDVDSDGYGDASSSVESCTLAAGFSANDQDCDDSDSSVNPDASEICDGGIDNNCDGYVDDADPSVSGTLSWYLDADVDGFGNSSFTTDACVQPSGFVADSSDCNDIDAAVNSDASEVCDGIDNDCNGYVDDDDATLDQSTRVLSYWDGDGDGYGDPSNLVSLCEIAVGYVDNNDDCDDQDSAINPDTPWYSDNDGDGFGALAQSVMSCTQPIFMVADSTDCDDGDSAVYPGAFELCDGLDNDCDGVVPNESDGADSTCPGLSCLDILNQDSSSVDDVYWIDPDGNGAYEAYCDMSTNGGGWTLLLKTAGDTDLDFDDSLWTNFNLLNETSLDRTATNAKMEGFLSLPIDELLGCFPTQGGHCIYADLSTGESAVDIFSSGSVQIGTGFNGEEYSGWSWQPNCKYFGINTPYNYRRARFGFTSNQENNCSSNDTAIGFGLGPSGHSAGGERWGSGQMCLSTNCTQGEIEEGFPGLLFGR